MPLVSVFSICKNTHFRKNGKKYFLHTANSRQPKRKTAPRSGRAVGAGKKYVKLSKDQS